MTDYTTGWEQLMELDSDNSARHWIHPDTSIVIHHGVSSYFFSYNKGKGPRWYCMFFADMKDAAKMVQYVMDGPDGRYNRCP